MLFSESTQEEYNLTSTVTEEISSSHFQETKGKDYALSRWVVKPVATGVCIVGLNRYVHTLKTSKKFQGTLVNIFLPIICNICIGSFEYPQHRFWLRNKKINF